MKVQHSVVIDNEDPANVHSVEFGSIASWDEHIKPKPTGKEITVLRSRYDTNGSFNAETSAEISIQDLMLLVEVGADHDIFDDYTIEVMQNALNKALMRNQVREVMDVLLHKDATDADEEESEPRH